MHVHPLFRSLLVLFAVSGSPLLVGCGGTATPPATPEAPATAKPGVKTPGEAKVGDKTTCPVSGDEFTVQASSEKTEYQGKTYYFCCGGCKAKFEADPAKYTKHKPQ